MLEEQQLLAKEVQTASIKVTRLHDILTSEDVLSLMSAFYPNSIQRQYENALFFIVLLEKELLEAQTTLALRDQLLASIQEIEAQCHSERQHIPDDQYLIDAYNQLQKKKAEAEVLATQAKEILQKLHNIFEELLEFADTINEIYGRHRLEAKDYLSKCITTPEGEGYLDDLNELAKKHSITAGASPYHGDASQLTGQHDLQKAANFEAGKALHSFGLEEPVQAWWHDRQSLLPNAVTTQIIFGLMHSQLPTETLQAAMLKLYQADKNTQGQDGRNLVDYLGYKHKAIQDEIRDQTQVFRAAHGDTSPEALQQEALELASQLNKLMPKLASVSSGHSSELAKTYQKLKTDINELSYKRHRTSAIGSKANPLSPDELSERIQAFRDHMQGVQSSIEEDDYESATHYTSLGRGF